LLNWLQSDPWGFLQFMLYRAPAVLVALTLHELAHGYIALKCGDTTARDRGRLTLNPLKHLDLVGTLSMFILGIGWAKPVPVNPMNFRNGRWDDLKVSLAGVTTNFILFLFATLVTIFLSSALFTREALDYWGREFFLGFQGDGFLLQLYPGNDEVLSTILRTPWLIHIQRFFLQLAYVNIGMGLFNLLPIPPLDGFHVANDIIFKGRINLSGTAFRVTHFLLLVLLFSSNFIGKWISGAIYAVQGAILPLLLALIPV
jgi:Zn-dependent protease